jgi:hypothetical protein
MKYSETCHVRHNLWTFYISENYKIQKLLLHSFFIKILQKYLESQFEGDFSRCPIYIVSYVILFQEICIYMSSFLGLL